MEEFVIITKKLPDPNGFELDIYNLLIFEDLKYSCDNLNSAVNYSTRTFERVIITHSIDHLVSWYAWKYDDIIADFWGKEGKRVLTDNYELYDKIMYEQEFIKRDDIII